MRSIEGDTRIEAAIEWVPHWTPEVIGFVNLQPTREGSHIDGLVEGAVDAMQRRSGLPRREARARVMLGLRAAVHVILRDARFGAPTKDRLDEPVVGKKVRALVAEALAQFPHLPP